MKEFEKLLIDTSALIEYMRGNRRAKELINKINISRRYLPHIVAAELYHGQYRIGKSRSEMSLLEGMISSFRMVLSDAETSHYFGQVKSALEKVGKPIPVNDVWIAALAKQHKLPLLAKDAHFRNVVGIELIDLGGF